MTRGIVEGTPGGFAAAYGLLRELEDSGLVRRGVLVAGLGAALATQLSATVVAGVLADWKGPRRAGTTRRPDTTRRRSA